MVLVIMSDNLYDFRSLTHFLYLCQHPSELLDFSGDIDCSMCGFPLKDLERYEFPKTFTVTEYISGSDMDGIARICKCCKFVYETNFYRHNCWISTLQRGKEKLERKDVILKLFTEKTPFSVYTTNTYKKQGWLSMLKSGIVLSENFVSFSWDMNIIQVHKNILKDFALKCLFLMEIGLTKTDLKIHDIPRRRYDKIPEVLKLTVDRFLHQNKNNLHWLWVVSFMPSLDENSEIKRYLNFDESSKTLFNQEQKEKSLVFVRRQVKKGSLLEFVGDINEC
jgi:hypothetical protein